MEIKVAVSVLGALAQETRLSIYRVSWSRRDVTGNRSAASARS